MRIFRNSAERRYCTSISWASKENPQARMKVQGHSSTTRAKKVHQILTHLTDMFKILTRMDAGHRKIGREILDLCGQKMRTRHMTLEKIATKPKVVTRVEAEAGAKFKIDLCIACSTRETLIVGQGNTPSSQGPKRRGPKSTTNYRPPQQSKRSIHLTRNNHHSYPPQTNLHINISTSLRIPIQLP
jgi:hypothetical protein